MCFLTTISYYNIALAMRNEPPIKNLHALFPQILFPRGEKGLGKHVFENEDNIEMHKANNSAQRVYVPLKVEK